MGWPRGQGPGKDRRFVGLEVSLLRGEKLKVVIEESRSNKCDLKIKKISSGADLPGVKVPLLGGVLGGA